MGAVDMVRSSGARRLDLQFVARVVGRTLLPMWFFLSSGLTLYHFASQDLLGIDARLYRFAALQALSGADPWAVHADGTAFAGPPPTLLLYLPSALLPDAVATAVIVGLGLAASIWAVRRLELPLWWLLFPPLFEAVIVGNPDALVLAVLLVRGPLAGVAAGLKIYALIPLMLARRWSALAVAAVVVAASLPLLPAFLGSLRSVSAVLDQQTAHLSAWGTWLVVPTLIALVALRRRGAEWLVVPALWPNSQRHYAAISVPAVSKSPIGAALMSLQLPLAPAAAVMYMAVEAWWHDRRRPAVPAPGVLSTTTSD